LITKPYQNKGGEFRKNKTNNKQNEKNSKSTTIPLCIVATITCHAGLVVLLISLLVMHHTGLVASCHTHFAKKNQPISSGISLFGINK
jgi:flagellar basal body-associated protein FliL